ncbi:hypothetical protein ZIOFF_009114 [Zingiber officinale]|uniref:Large ribosomal subunit protein uL29m n=1 Tax=Zingiber officinale TaxID=94328 RepID=A0A8J5LVV5_ZINOF|nr:hypothetical protein ZIOFF_009114 [Zingiber officinale]
MRTGCSFQVSFTMFVSRIVRRAFGAAARSKSYSTSSEASDSAAAAVSAKRTLNPLEEFFEPDRSADEEKPVTYGIISIPLDPCHSSIAFTYLLLGRGWKASELRLKSWDDLHKLWYVFLKEKNMLMTQRQMLHTQNLRFPHPERIQKGEEDREEHLEAIEMLLWKDFIIAATSKFNPNGGLNECCLDLVSMVIKGLKFSSQENIRTQKLVQSLTRVRKSMCRLKHVLTERAIAEPDPRRSAEMKRMINAM